MKKECGQWKPAAEEKKKVSSHASTGGYHVTDVSGRQLE
jgi:hypothetical protein